MGRGAKGRDGLMSPPPQKAGEMAHAARTHCSDFSKLFCISIFILLHPITPTAIGVFPYFGYSK